MDSAIRLRRDAAADAVQRQLALAQQGRSVLSHWIKGGRGLEIWRHYPRHDVLEASGRWQFYFHVHDANDPHAGPRHPQEYGHFHVFRRSPRGQLSHLTGLSTDARGVPLMWFTTNQWVTGERWQPAASLIRSLAQIRWQVRGPMAGLAAWLNDLIVVYAQTIAELLQQRDAACARYATQHGLSSRQTQADRRVAVWSSAPLNWPDDALRVIGEDVFCTTRR